MPMYIRQEKCSGCNTCVEVCPEDVYRPGAKGQPPVVQYPEECFHCGACMMDCPEGCIEPRLPLALRPRFRRFAEPEKKGVKRFGQHHCS